MTIALLALSGVVSGLLWWTFVRINARRRAGGEDEKALGKTEEEIDEMGDESPRYIYVT